MLLLKVANLSRSSYDYVIKHLDEKEKYQEEKKLIRKIWEKHKKRYGYRRITVELRKKRVSLEP